MPRADADRNLLFGILALQMDFITRDALIAAMHAWVLEKYRPIGEILVERGALAPDLRALLEPMVVAHVERHGGDPAASLAALSSIDTASTLHHSVTDPDFRESLASVTGGRLEDTRDARTEVQPGPPRPGVRYRKIRDHARGGLGVVFIARDEELNREVALKEIQDRYADDPGRRARFLIEAEVTGGLEHPGIVPVYGLGSYEDGRPFYAMRFIKGDSLKESIAAFHADASVESDPGRRSLALQKLLRQFLDVCDAIEYAHSRGVLHRDLKPDNVMIGRYGETLVVDWGLAKPVGRSGEAASAEASLRPASAGSSDETMPGSVVGTPAYMSPEQAAGELERLGPASDVYSLGATLYALLTGRSPFAGKSVGLVLADVRAGRFPRPREVARWLDPALEAVCLKAMALRPEARYDSPRALAREIEAWIAGEPVAAYLEPLPARVGRWARRHRSAVSALGLSMATAVVLLTISNVLVSQAQRETTRALGRVKEEQGHTAEALRRADADFRRARQAVEDYFTTVSEEVLLDEPGMQPLRGKLLRSALDYHGAFLRDHGGDPGVEADLALSHWRYANLAGLTDRGRDEAISHLKTSLEMFRGLARRHPDDPKYRKLVALTLADFGTRLAEKTGEGDAEARVDREAIDLCDALLRERPGDATVLECLARALVGLGFRQSRQTDGAEEAGRTLGRARDILQRLIADHPDTIRHRIRLGDFHNAIYGNLVGDDRRQAEALRASQDAIEVYQELIKRTPNSPRFRFKLGLLRDNRGMLHARAGRYEDAAVEAEEARHVLSDVVRTNPEVVQYRPYLGLACMKLGRWLTSIGAGERALDSLREAADAFERYSVDRPGDNPFLDNYFVVLSNRGSALAGLGRYEEAVSEFRRAEKLVAALIQRDPSNIFAQGNAMGNCLNMAYALGYAGRHEEAVAAFEQVRSIAREFFGGDLSHIGVDEVVLKLRTAYSAREIGRAREADEVVDAARKIAGEDPERSYFLARYDARGASLLARAGGSAKSVEALKDRAMAGLGRAASLGFTGSTAPRRDEAWKSVRDRPGFALLMMDLAMPSDPFARLR